MTTSEPIHVAFVWHMHQPYYRSARTGAFQMPWARLHALKDYFDMVEVLSDYPSIHQTFNLVPSLVEQLEEYASGGFVDVYWEHTIKPAADLSWGERAFLVERMCERSDHPRTRSHPRYLELAHKREAGAHLGWTECAATFTVEELRDLQVWFNLAWFDPGWLNTDPLCGLAERGRGFTEDDKSVLARAQSEILARVIPAYRGAADRGQIELSTSPYFHPILPLLINSDSARIGASDTILPRRRFAHPEDAWEQVETGLAKHQRVFGSRPRGMWCSEQAVGEEVLPLLMRAGVEWTISDQAVLSRSVQGAAAAPGRGRAAASPYRPYRLPREVGELALVLRDHTLSDLIGFAYQRWDSRDAAADLLRRIREAGAFESAGEGAQMPLITVALDGENAWEYYPRDGHDFLRYLYEGLATDPSLQCVTISEHLDQYPPSDALEWLHTGSWIGADLRTWSGDAGHNLAWDMLHEARDLAAARRMAERATAEVAAPAKADSPAREGPSAGAAPLAGAAPQGVAAPQGGAAPLTETILATGAVPSAETTYARNESLETAWRHVLIAEGSDWFWWFGEHHRTELDHVWDQEFREHLQHVYRSLGEPVPPLLYAPLLPGAARGRPSEPAVPVRPIIDGKLTDDDGWSGAGLLLPDHPSTMQRAEGPHIAQVRFGFDTGHLYLLLIPRAPAELAGLELELEAASPGDEVGSLLTMALRDGGRVDVSCVRGGALAGNGRGAWDEVAELALTFALPGSNTPDLLELTLRVGHGEMRDHVFRSAGPVPVREPGT